MQQANTVLSSNVRQLTSMPQSTTHQSTGHSRTEQGAADREQLAYAVNQVFAWVDGYYPRTFRTGWASPEQVPKSKNLMLDAMKTLNVVPTWAALDRLKRAMLEKGGDWPPSIPEIVKTLAPIPQDFGLKPLADAWLVLNRNVHQPDQIKCPAIRAAMVGLTHDLQTATSQRMVEKCERRFASAYQGVVNRVMAGEELRPVQALTHQREPTKYEPTDHVKQGMQQLSDTDKKLTGSDATQAMLKRLRSGARA